jgi:hypothetical protein
VNKKLTGVYDSIQDLETHLRVIDGKIAVDNQRLEAVEAELERIKQVRKALGIIYPNASTGTTGGVNDVVVNNYPVNSEFLASESNDEFAYTDQRIGDRVVRKWYRKA